MGEPPEPRHRYRLRGHRHFSGLARWFTRIRPSRRHIATMLETRWVPRIVMLAILASGVALGIETSGLVADSPAEPIVLAINETLVGLFVVELILRIAAYGGRFFRDPWSVFDLVVVAVSVGSGAFAVLRLLRAFRILRLLSATPALRHVVSGMLAAIPNLGAGLAVLSIILYVAAVTATYMYHDIAPEYFGQLGTSLFTLFQTMTGEAWPDIARAVLANSPSAWIFFVTFIIVTTFGLLNILASAVSTGFDSARDQSDDGSERLAEIDTKLQQLLIEVRSLREPSGLTEGSDTKPVRGT